MLIFAARLIPMATPDTQYEKRNGCGTGCDPDKQSTRKKRDPLDMHSNLPKKQRSDQLDTNREIGAQPTQ